MATKSDLYTEMMAERNPPHFQYPFNGLISMALAPRNQDIKRIASYGVRMIGDSGAYSVASRGEVIDIGEFSEWIDDLKNVFCSIASLDVIGDAEGSWKNFLDLRNRGHQVVPTVHYPSKPETLDRYAEMGIDFLGLGGMVPRNDPANLKRWLVSMFRYARDKYPDMKFHGWGCTSQQLVEALPFWSVDSSGFGSAHRYARVSLIDNNSSKRIGVDLNGRDIYKYTDELKRWYGLNAAEIATSNESNRYLMGYVAARTAANLEEFLRKRHGPIDAPKYGVIDQQAGINVHCVIATHYYTILQSLIDR